MLKTPIVPGGFWGTVFKGQIGGEGFKVCDFLLFGWWGRNRAVPQESCAQPEITILHLGGGPGSC